jgi:hypothetical protein
MDWLFSSGLLVFAAQIACAVHVLRGNASRWWLLPIFFFPPLGVVFYVILEVLGPGGGGGRGRTIELREIGGRKLSLRELEQQAKESPTVEHRMQLAQRLLLKGEVQRAIALYEECLDGVYADDPNLRYELAEAYHAAERPQETLEQLDWLRRHEYHDYLRRRDLLEVIALSRLGRNEEALAKLSERLPRQMGEQAHFEHARILLALNRSAEARAVIHDMFSRWSRQDRRYRKREREWFQAAKKLEREL